MKISMVDSDMVDRLGHMYRQAEDLRQLGLVESDIANGPPEGFQDFGLVEYNGNMYYMCGYTKVSVLEEA